MKSSNDLSLETALCGARDTKALKLGVRILDQAPDIFAQHFPDRPAVIVADTRTFSAAGRAVVDAFRRSGHETVEPFIFDDPALFAAQQFLDALQESLATHDGIPVAVGSGTINDVTKLAAHRTSRPYMAVATAASMDGYTAFGASITHNGLKQTFDCPAPRAVLADIEVIAAAPAQMNAWGYADLLAKITAGADWIVADALGVEQIDPVAWDLVQKNLRAWLADPASIRSGKIDAIGDLVRGLMMTGFAMQRTCTSRPASGAEHQFSHLWDMEHLMVDGASPSHGAKVGIGTLAVARLYETLPEEFDEVSGVAAMPASPSAARNAQATQASRLLHDRPLDIDPLFDLPELRDLARRETAAKRQPTITAEQWRAIRKKVADHLIPTNEMSEMLAAAGAPNWPEEIGLSHDRLRESYSRAYHIRRRYTVLDLAVQAGVLDTCLDKILGGR